MATTIDVMSNFTIKKMRIFCAIHEALEKGSKQPLGELCKQMGAKSEEFIIDLEQKLFGKSGKGKLAVRFGVHRSYQSLGAAFVHNYFKRAVDAAEEFGAREVSRTLHEYGCKSNTVCNQQRCGQSVQECSRLVHPMNQVEFVVKDGFKPGEQGSRTVR